MNKTLRDLADATALAGGMTSSIHGLNTDQELFMLFGSISLIRGLVEIYRRYGSGPPGGPRNNPPRKRLPIKKESSNFKVIKGEKTHSKAA